MVFWFEAKSIMLPKWSVTGQNWRTSFPFIGNLSSHKLNNWKFSQEFQLNISWGAALLRKQEVSWKDTECMDGHDSSHWASSWTVARAISTSVFYNRWLTLLQYCSKPCTILQLYSIHYLQQSIKCIAELFLTTKLWSRHLDMKMHSFSF